MKKTYQVFFNFGSAATVSVIMYEGKTVKECIRLRSKNIEGYIDENGEYIEL